MRRSLLICLFFFPLSLSALPLGNPIDASLLFNGIFTQPTSQREEYSSFFNNCSYNFRLGYFGDYVYNRHLEVHHDDTKEIRQTEISTNAGYIGVTLLDLAELFSTFGASRINITALQSVWGPNPNNFTYLLSDTDFSWSVGLRGTIWQWCGFGIGAEGQYFTTQPNLSTFRVEGGVPEYLEFDLKFREWQVGVGAAYQIQVGCFSAIIPYAGIKFSCATLKTGNAKNFEGTDTFFNLRNQRYFGYAVGLTFITNAIWSVSGEARFVDERAFSFLTQFVF
jgi:major outer membrane protein